jgi:hypothetical protein
MNTPLEMKSNTRFSLQNTTKMWQYWGRLYSISISICCWNFGVYKAAGSNTALYVIELLQTSNCCFVLAYIEHAAGSCVDSIHYSSIQLAYQNVGNKSRRFSNKVKCLLVEGSKLFFVPFNGVCNSQQNSFHGQNKISSFLHIYVQAELSVAILNI